MLKRYGALSALQLVTTVVVDGMTVVINLMLIKVIESSDDGYYIFADIVNVFQVFDTLMFIIVIYIGFIRRDTNLSCCQICKEICSNYRSQLRVEQVHGIPISGIIKMQRAPEPRELNMSTPERDTPFTSDVQSAAKCGGQIRVSGGVGKEENTMITTLSSPVGRSNDPSE